MQVQVLTNSWRPTTRHRACGLRAPPARAAGHGVELFEMRSELTGLRGAFSTTGSTGGSRAMLHSKLLVMDGRLLVVGR